MTTLILGQTANIFTSSFEDSSKPSNEYGVSSAETLTMSSLEIAEYTGKNKADVNRDIRTMLDQLEIDVSSFAEMFPDSYGRMQPGFTLPKDLTITLVSGYSAPMRHAIVKRWLELESAKPLFTIPTTLSAALRLAADQSEQIDAQKAQLAIAAPKVAALDLISTADGMLNLQAAGKALQQQPNKFIAWLRENGWIYKRPGSSNNCARAEKFNAGYLTTKARTVIQPDGTERVREQCMVTPKGLAKLAGVFSQ